MFPKLPTRQLQQFSLTTNFALKKPQSNPICYKDFFKITQSGHTGSAKWQRFWSHWQCKVAAHLVTLAMQSVSASSTTTITPAAQRFQLLNRTQTDAISVEMKIINLDGADPLIKVVPNDFSCHNPIFLVNSF